MGISRFVKERIVDVLRLILFNLSKLSPRDNNIWVFGTGKNPNESQKYLYNYIVENYPEIRPIWIVKRRKHLEYTKKIGKEVYYHRSLKAIKYMLKAKVFITCYGPDGFGIFHLYGGAILAELFHYTNFKLAKFDYRKRRFHKLKKFIEILKGDRVNIGFVSSENDKKQMRSGYEELIGELVITGKPKNDILFKKVNRQKLIKEWTNRDIEFSKIISYLPSHRMGNEESDIEVLMYLRPDWDEKRMEGILEENNAILLIKKHPSWEMENKFLNKKSNRIIFLPTIIDTQDILRISDILITDYSTVFIDYLLLNRPIIFTPFDLEHFKKVRGFYYEYETITPGPKVVTFDDLTKAILEYLKNPNKDSDLRLSVQKIFHKYIDDRSCERVMNELLKRIE